MKVVKIYPRTNLHTFLHSDTLWGNIIYAFRLLNGVEETTKLLKKYEDGNVPFKISSIFPFAQNPKKDEDTIYYFPKPILNIQFNEAQNPEEMAYLKTYKKIKYIEKKLFEDIINGRLDEAELFQKFLKWKNAEDNLENLSKSSQIDTKEINNLKEIIHANRFKYLTGFTPIYNLHNSIDRMSSSTLVKESRGQLYWEEEYNFFGNEILNRKINYLLESDNEKEFSQSDINFINGIYFLVDGEDTDLIRGPLNLLSHLGIGGNKSIGKGSFIYKIDDFNLELPEKYNSYISLSLYHPHKDEKNLFLNKENRLCYDIVTRIGMVGKDFNVNFSQKNPVICFTEASTFFVKENLRGTLIRTAKYNEYQDIFSYYLFFGVKANLRLI